MNERVRKRFEITVAGLVRGVSGVTALVGFLIVIPLTLWLGWMHRSTIANSVLVTLFCLAFAWLLVSLLLCQSRLRRLGLTPEDRLRLFSGPRPSDPDELRAWSSGWHFMFAVLAVLLCLIAIPIASWLSGR
jgi:hypothetical protein